MSAVRGQVLLPPLLALALAASFVVPLPGAQLVVYACALLSAAAVVLTPGCLLLGRRVPPMLVVLLSWAAASVLWSAHLGGTVRALIDLAAYAAIGGAAGVLLTMDQQREAVSRIVRALIATTVVTLIVAPRWSTEPARDGAPGWHGPFDHKNGLGAFLVLAAITLYFDRRRRKAPWFVLIGVLLVGSQSSTAIALLAVAGAVVVWQRGLTFLRTAHQRSLYLGASIAMAAVGTVLALTRPDLFAALLGRDPSLTGRTDIWAAVIRQIAERPLIGHGWGGVWREPSLPTLQIRREARFNAFYAHNGYLDVLLQVGAVGLAMLLLALLPALIRVWRTRAADASFWATLIVVTSLIAAVSESSPLTGSNLILLFAIVVAAQQPEVLAAMRAGHRATVPGQPIEFTSRAGSRPAPAGGGRGPGTPGRG